jgi:O-antigen chain-terminating methyltransferase
VPTKLANCLYLDWFSGCANVLDMGCGRGEFLELMRTAKVPARGIDLSPESVAICRNKGLAAEPADLFEYLSNLPEAGLDGIFCSQVVEHISPGRLPEMIRLCAGAWPGNSVIALEGPQPGMPPNLRHPLLLDPTHQGRAASVAGVLEGCGMRNIAVHKPTPAVDSPSLKIAGPVPRAFFGDLVAIRQEVISGQGHPPVRSGWKSLELPVAPDGSRRSF